MSTPISVSSDSVQAPMLDSIEDSMRSAERLQPIPVPSEPLQYRAIGLIRGRYEASEQLTQGTLIASDGTEINAVLLGRMMSLLKKHLDLSLEHLWVVYPRTRENEQDLHTQIVGVWEPETLDSKTDSSESASSSIDHLMGEDYFSIRGEVIFHCSRTEQVKVKIHQAPRKKGDKPRSFKLNLKGTLTGRTIRNFWEFHILRQGSDLVIQEASWIAPIPKTERSWSNRHTNNRPYQGRDRTIQRRTGATPKPVLSRSALPAPRPISTPAPVIRRRKPASE